MLKQKRTTILIALAIAAMVILVVSQAWKGVPLTVENVGSMLIIGISIGSVYAVSASGLVVTYTTTGIFNFAHGAIGCFLAFVYWELRVNRHWAAIPALFVVILGHRPARSARARPADHAPAACRPRSSCS